MKVTLTLTKEAVLVIMAALTEEKKDITSIRKLKRDIESTLNEYINSNPKKIVDTNGTTIDNWESVNYLYHLLFEHKNNGGNK